MKRAEKAELPYQEFMARLLRAQWQANQENGLKWRIERAGLPEKWTLETFPFKRQPGVKERQIRTFAELEFIPKAENIVFVGGTGVGKTGLASGLYGDPVSEVDTQGLGNPSAAWVEDKS